MKELLSIIVLACLGLCEGQAQQLDTLELAIFHRRDASKLMDWKVVDGDTLDYLPYYPQESEYFRFLVYSFGSQLTDPVSIELLSMSEQDTLNITQWSDVRIPSGTKVLQVDVRGLRWQRVTLENESDVRLTFWISFARKE